MKKEYTTRLCTDSLADSTLVWELWKELFPMMPVPDSKSFHHMLQKKCSGLEDICLLVFLDAQLVAFSTCFPTNTPQIIRMIGGVRTTEQGNGIGYYLLQLTENYAYKNDIKKLHCMTFSTYTHALEFLEKAHFITKDQLVWNSFNLNQTISPSAQMKHQKVCASNIRFVSGLEFSKIRSDWDRCWWEHIKECLLDIPSDIPVEMPSFDDWRSFLNIPSCRRKNSIFALDNNTLVGLIEMGEPSNGVSNINHSSVVRSYRRQGISTALKVEAIHWAQQNNLTMLQTQNHINNPMLGINLKFGFVEQYRQCTLEKILSL